jgi:tetratricopeptide (TPR) repeat protein
MLHAGSAVLIFFIYGRILDLARVPVSARGVKRGLALFGAAVFLLHPLQTESVDYIAGRSEVISGFFYFAAWLLFLRHFEKETGLGLAVKICILGGLAVLGKESAISLPAILLLTDFYFAEKPITTQLRRRFNLWALFVSGGLIAVFLILRTLTSATSAGFNAGISPFDYGLTQCRAIVTYLRLFLFPVGQNGDWQLRFYHSLMDGAAAVYVAGLILLVGLTIWLYKRARLASCGLAAFLLMLAPTSSIVPIKDAIAERRMYLPIAGLILGLLGVAAGLRWPARWRWTAAAAILLCCSALSWHRSAVWASDFNFWADSLARNPANARAHFGLGSAMLIRGRCDEGVREFSAARATGTPTLQDVSPEEVIWNLAGAYQCAKKPAEALALYRYYAAVLPSAAAYDKIGFLDATLGNSDAAVLSFEHSIKLDPNDATAYAYRGLARFASNDFTGARADLTHALELDPQNQAAAEGMARLSAGR